MDFLDEPGEMSAEERLAEVAAILASGYLRMRESRVPPAPGPSETPALTEKPLDSRRARRPCGDEGLTRRDAAPAEVQG
jgi:hypothetical protein